MIDTFLTQLAGLYHMIDQCRQISSVSRCSHLIKDNIQALPLGRQRHPEAINARSPANFVEP